MRVLAGVGVPCLPTYVRCATTLSRQYLQRDLMLCERGDRDAQRRALTRTWIASIALGLIALVTGLLADAFANFVEGDSVPTPLSPSAVDNWAGAVLVGAFAYPLLIRRRQAIEQEISFRQTAAELAIYVERDQAANEAHEERLRAVRGCLHERALTILFQPIVRTSDGQVVGAEALARFSDGRPADRWFGDAAAVGLGVELELLAINLALQQAREHLPEDVYVSVNVSPATMTSEHLRAVVEAHGRPAVIEMTEHIPVEESAELISSLAWARSAGVRIAADDAGNGYAGLCHLLRLAPDIIKLDRALVTGVDTDPAKRALIVAVTGFASEIGAEVVAEGVESEAELLTLAGAGVDGVQGYLLGRPAPLPLPFSVHGGLVNPRVLVVDEDPSARRTLTLLLGRRGFDVIGDANDGPATIGYVRAARPDAVIMDFTLPAMDGAELLKHLRKASPTTAVVGFSEGGAAELRTAVDGFVSKADPDAMTLLPSLVRQCIVGRASLEAEGKSGRGLI